MRSLFGAVAIAGVMANPAAAQDAKTVIANASKAMGVDGLTSIHYYGVAANGNLGQNNNANQPWPLTAANDYVRAIDFAQPASRATWATYAVPVTGGAASLVVGTPQAQQNITPQSPWGQLLEIYLTPWGFLKAAVANDATVRSQTIDGRRYHRTLAPDALAKSGRKPIVEGFAGDKRVFQDGTRTFEVHVIKGLPHADGLVVGWLPKERLLVYADMFNLPTEATGPVPNPAVVGTQVFAANLERLNIDGERIMSVHSLNPDRLTSRAELLKSLGR